MIDIPIESIFFIFLFFFLHATHEIAWKYEQGEI